MVWNRIYYFIYTFQIKSTWTANANVLIQTEPEKLGDIFEGYIYLHSKLPVGSFSNKSKNCNPNESSRVLFWTRRNFNDNNAKAALEYLENHRWANYTWNWISGEGYIRMRWNQKCHN